MLERHFNTTVTIADGSESDPFGNPSFENQREIRARIKHKVTRVVNASGDEVVSDTVFVTEDKVTYDNLIWLEGTNTSDVSQSVYPKTIESGSKLSDPTHFHYKVYL